MTEQSIYSKLKESFSTSSKEDWLRVALRELKNENSIHQLVWKGGDLNFSPYYDKRDLSTSECLTEQDAAFDQMRSLSSGGWRNLPKITVLDEKKANAIALQSLSWGAEGVLFDISRHATINLDVLLDKVDCSICNISFVASAEDKNIGEKISLYLHKHAYEPLAIMGTVFCDQLPLQRENAMNMLAPFKNFQVNGLLVSPDSPVAEISTSLIHGVMCMNHLTEFGIEREVAFRSIGVSLASDENFFVTIAKLKALRALWYQLSQAYQISNYEPRHLQLHGRSETGSYEKFQPHANIIKNTYDATALVLGGANALTICPADEQNAMMYRIALHASNILKEESHFDKVADATAGAYTIDVMTRDFSERAWIDFQNKAAQL